MGIRRNAISRILLPILVIAILLPCPVFAAPSYSRTKLLVDGDANSTNTIMIVSEIRQSLGYGCTNRSTAGATMAAAIDNNNIVYRSDNQGNKNIDYVVISIGVQDYLKDVPLGERTSVDTHTFYGALNYVLSTIRADSQYSTIALLAPSDAVGP